MKKCFLLALSLCFATIVNAQLSGTYTINSNSSQNPDYTSLSAAASALSAGVSGQVIFEVAPGTYEEYVTVNQINGASATNRVIFRGMGADNQQVVITSNAGYTDNSTLKLSGADYVTFENMMVTTSSTAKARLLVFDGQCDYDRFENVRFVGIEVPTNSSDNDKNLVHMNNGDGIVNHDTQFVGCQFINGCIALYLQGKNMTLFNENVLVENCNFENQQFKSIYITFYNNVVLRGNTVVNANDFKTDYNAIDIFQCYNGAIIEKNVMNITRTTSYSTVFRIRPLVGTAENHVIIRNNIVNLQANSSSYAFAIDYNECAYIDFAHNTLKCTGTGENINIFVQKNGTNFNFYNNLLVNTTNGYVFRFNNSVDSRVCDYNRIQYTGANIGRFTTTDCATLSDWTTATGFDSHSAVCTPNFVGTNNLHITDATGLTVANPLSYVTTDIDDQNRSTTAPCAGADELASGTNLPPVVANPVSNITFETYPASQTVNVNNTFNDPDDPNENIVITVASNSNPSLVSATLNNRILTVTRLASTGGTATITLNAESAGQSVQTSFSVECIAEDLPPVVANQLAPINFTSYPQTLTFDLSNTFDDPDNNNDFIEITVQSCPSEITATINDEDMLSVTRNTANAFTNQTLVIRATSNGKHVDMNVSVSGVEVVITVGTATFDDVALGANGYWQGESGDNEMFSGGWIFTNYYMPEYMFWGGFTASNHTDLNQSGLSAQYTAATGAGYDGTTQYGVAYCMGVQTDVYASDGQAHTVTGCYVTNNLWAYQNMHDGDATATPFGGTTGNDPDWFKLTATGKNANGQTIGTAEFYLADYRFANNDEDYIINTWEWFDLTSLGAVHTISFSLSSSKNNSGGMITPAYFCLENFNGEAPLPPTPPQDLPPYVVNPVDDVVFNEYPETITINLDGVVTDDDDPDENIVYRIVSNSNENELQAVINNKVLTLTRLSREESTATLVIRATSDDQYVEFDVNIIINFVPDGVDENEMEKISVYPNPAHDFIRVETQLIASVQRVEIYNVTGQMMLSTTDTEINVSTLPEGVYFVAVIAENQKFVKRIVIK
ncbi:MAG: DUF4465 domain-containing protein [Bacteroidales bacterium]|nr:DUF4465 domain-containing protein [Bacteroidales bacterium]